MAGANIMWGMMSPISKFVLAAGLVSPLLLTQFRVVGAALLFWVAGLFTPKDKVPFPDILRMAGAACLAIVFNQGSFIFGVGLTSPSEASIITTTMPMWVILLSWLFLGDSITGKKFAGLLLGASGALILVLNAKGSGVEGDNPTLGDILVLTAQLSYALYLTIFKNFIRKYSLITLMKWMFLFASIAMSPALFHSIPETMWSQIDTLQWCAVAYVVVGGTFLAYILSTAGQKVLSPSVVGMYNYVQPIVASMLGIAIGLDNFNFPKAIAIVLIFSGVYLVTKSVALKQK